MKSFIFSLSVAALAIVLLWQVNRSGTTYMASSEQVLLKISRSTTQADLDRIAEDLKAHHGIKADFSGSTFLPNDQVLALKMTVQTPKGVGTTEVSPVALLFNSYGFSVNYSPDAEVVFSVGAI